MLELFFTPKILLQLCRLFVAMLPLRSHLLAASTVPQLSVTCCWCRCCRRPLLLQLSLPSLPSLLLLGRLLLQTCCSCSCYDCGCLCLTYAWFACSSPMLKLPLFLRHTSDRPYLLLLLERQTHFSTLLLPTLKSLLLLTPGDRSELSHIYQSRRC